MSEYVDDAEGYYVRDSKAITPACPHHPEYKPESGEPTTEYVVEEGFNSDRTITCPYCWKARAQWLHEKQTKVKRVSDSSVSENEKG